MMKVIRIGGIFIWVIFCWFAFPECILGEESETSDNKTAMRQLKKIIYETGGRVNMGSAKCIEKLEEFVRSHPKSELTDDALFQQLEEYFGAGLYENAIKICDRIITSFPQATIELTEVLIELMWCGHGRPEYTAEIDYFEKYPDLTSDRALKFKAEALDKLGKKKEGKECLLGLIKKYPNGLYEKEDEAFASRTFITIKRPHQIAVEKLIADALKQGKTEVVWQLYVDYYSKWHNENKVTFSWELAKQFAAKEQFKKAVHIMNDVVGIIKKAIETYPETQPVGYSILYFGGSISDPPAKEETDWEHIRQKNIEAIKRSLAEAESDLEKYSQEEKK